MRKKIAKTAAALMAFISLPAAADWYTFPGAICRGPSNTPTSYGSDGRISHSSDFPLMLVCPLQRNVSASYAESVTVRVTTLDAHYAHDICCTANVHAANGALLAGSAWVCTSGSDTTNHKLVSMSVPSVVAGSNGYVALRCSIPGLYYGAQSSLVSIEVSE